MLYQVSTAHCESFLYWMFELKAYVPTFSNYVKYIEKLYALHAIIKRDYMESFVFLFTF